MEHYHRVSKSRTKLVPWTSIELGNKIEKFLGQKASGKFLFRNILKKRTKLETPIAL